MKIDNKAMNDEEALRRNHREALMNMSAFRMFLVELMEKSRFGKSAGNLDKYSRGRRDAYASIVEEFVFGTDGGAALVGEFLDKQKDKKETK